MSASAPDLFLEAVQAKDPVAPIHRLRAEDPVHWVPAMDLWVLTRHDDVKWLLNDPEHATRDRSVWEHYVPREAGAFEFRAEPPAVAKAANSGLTEDNWATFKDDDINF